MTPEEKKAVNNILVGYSSLRIFLAANKNDNIFAAHFTTFTGAYFSIRMALFVAIHSKLRYGNES